MKKWLLPLLVCLTIQMQADVRLPKIFGDNMVIQRGKPVPVWGWAGPGEKVTVQWIRQVKTTKAGEDGRWLLKLDPEPAGGPYQMIVKGKNSVVFHNVMIGEVWICSGQSNMEFEVSGVINAEQEMANANYPQIRQIKVGRSISLSPKDDLSSGEWNTCDPKTVGNFTAVGYFFARELYNQLKIPVGLINTSWGGTHSETWTSKEAFQKNDEFKALIDSLPTLNLDSLVQVRKRKTVQKIESMQGHLPVRDEALKWKDQTTNDAGWPRMHLPGLWDYQQLGGLDGVVWFRRTVKIPAGEAANPAVLELAMIDDNDVSYINGIKVGATNAYNVKRKYIIPAGVLREGDNVIAVRAEDTGGGGGIYGDSTDLKLTVGNRIIPLSGQWGFQVEAIYGGENAVGPNTYPTLLFNAMLHPLIPFAIEGAIWYQGEANAWRAYQYRKAFPMMITDWRQHWGQGDFPFYFVQLATFNADNGNSARGSTWAELREAQAMTLALPNTGMSVTTDIGDPKDIHPRNKQEVGRRLAAIALDHVYGQAREYSGPMYQSIQVQGNKVIISFTHLGKGLLANDKYGYVRGFEIAGADRKFHYAKTFVEGDHVVAYCDEVDSPVAVRYGWADDASDCNLYNRDGFPAAPFRSDQWKGITEGEKFRFE